MLCFYPSSNSQAVNVPKLRFPGFADEWVKLELGSVACYNKKRTTVVKSHFVSTENMLQNCNGIEPYNDSTPVEGIEFSENDILIANIRPYLKKAWKTEFSGACSTDVLSINPTAINAKFLFHCIEKDDFFNYVMSAAKGSKMPRGDKQHIMEYNIAFPSELEQEKISAFIDLLTKRITAQSKLIESLKLYKRGVITNIFNTLFDNYQKVKLSTIGTFKSGIGFKESLQGHIDLEIPFYKVSDMNSEANTITMQIANNYVSQSMVKDLKTTPFDKDSIIFAKVGAALFMERKRIAHSPFLIDNNMMAFQPGTDVNFDYIFAFFQYTKLSSYAQVGALPSLNASDIGEIQIPIPQHEQQKKVAFIAKKLEQEIDNQSAYFAHLNDIKRGILQQMFI